MLKFLGAPQSKCYTNSSILHPLGTFLLQTFKLLSLKTLYSPSQTSPNLEQLTLNELAKAVDDSILIGLGKKCPRLSSLSLVNCCEIGNRGASAMIRGCREMQMLDMTGESFSEIVHVLEGGGKGQH